MGCNCKKPVTNVNRNNVVTPRIITSTPRIQATITTQSTPAATPAAGMDDDKLRVEKLRREAIRRALGR